MHVLNYKVKSEPCIEGLEGKEGVEVDMGGVGEERAMRRCGYYVEQPHKPLNAYLSK